LAKGRSTTSFTTLTRGVDDSILNFHFVAASDELAVDVSLKIGTETIFNALDGFVDARGVLAVANKPGSDVIRV
jgi:hypothetical protein